MISKLAFEHTKPRVSELWRCLNICGALSYTCVEMRKVSPTSHSQHTIIYKPHIIGWFSRTWVETFGGVWPTGSVWSRGAIVRPSEGKAGLGLVGTWAVRLRTAVSTSPLAWTKSFSVANSRKASELNCGPLSDTIMSSMPCVKNSSFRIKLTLVDDCYFSFLISNLH